MSAAAVYTWMGSRGACSMSASERASQTGHNRTTERSKIQLRRGSSGMQFQSCFAFPSRSRTLWESNMVRNNGCVGFVLRYVTSRQGRTGCNDARSSLNEPCTVSYPLYTWPTSWKPPASEPHIFAWHGLAYHSRAVSIRRLWGRH